MNSMNMAMSSGVSSMTMSSMPTSSSDPSSMSGTSSSDVGGISGMNMADGGMMGMSQMAMVFFTSHTTPLYSNAWTPNSVGDYAGTCIFLIVLAFILRTLYACKYLLESHWRRQDIRRRYFIPGNHQKADNEISDSDAESARGLSPLELASREKGSKAGVLIVNGFSEQVRLVEAAEAKPWKVQPWRLGVDLTRAALVTVMVGVGYLLMIAVMTMNVGYFLSVLAGAFLGELLVGRYGQHVEDHH